MSFTFPNGFKFSYSGDCRPSRAFARIGKDSTVLVHEATFADDMLDDAKAKKHSTMGEAIGVGRMMDARRVLLTHFSQRYQNYPERSSAEADEVAKGNDSGRGDSVHSPPKGARDGSHNRDSADGANTTVGVQVEEDDNYLRLDDDVRNQKMADLDSAGGDHGSEKPGDTSPHPPLAGAISPVAEASSADVEPETVPNPPPGYTRWEPWQTVVLPRIEERARDSDMIVGIAFDYMRVKVGEIAHLEYFKPALRRLDAELKATAERKDESET